MVGLPEGLRSDVSSAISDGESDQSKTCERARRPAAQASPPAHLVKGDQVNQSPSPSPSPDPIALTLSP